MTNSLDYQYCSLLRAIEQDGEWESNRTEFRAKTLPSWTIRHNMKEGFPLLTIKKTPFKSIKVELEGFIKGITSKKWYQERGCTIWNEWCNPKKVPYGHSEESKAAMAAEDDLGLIYGSEWRDFHDPNSHQVNEDHLDEFISRGKGVDQLKNIVNKLKSNPQDRRMICSAWNPLALDQMALPPCHYAFQISVINNKLNLAWVQRSCDVPLGIPFNIASYGLLLHLLAKEGGFEEGQLTGFLTNVHYYENQQDGVNEILSRYSMFMLPKIQTEFTSIFNWEYSDTKLLGYNSLEKINIPIAV